MEWNKELIQKPGWKEEISNKIEKERIAKILASKVKSKDIIGFGSGSTSYLATIEIAKKVENEELDIIAIPTSYEIEMLCTYLGIKTDSIKNKKPDWCFDGTDEIDDRGFLIKGRGAAMFREKLNIKSAPKTYILADSSKFVRRLGENYPIPIEVNPDSINYVKQEIDLLNPIEINLRMASKKDGPVITEDGNFILDVKFNNIEEDLEYRLKRITGVIETGLFTYGYNFEIIK